MTTDKKEGKVQSGVKSNTYAEPIGNIAPSNPSAPSGIFNKPQVKETSRNPIKVTVIKALIDSYSVNGGTAYQVDTARKAYKELVSAVEQIQTLTGVDLRECLAYLIKAVASNDTGAYGRETAFRFLPEVAKKNVMDRTSRFLNMIIFYANSDKAYFNQMVDVDFSVGLIVNQEVRDQVAAYFNV